MKLFGNFTILFVCLSLNVESHAQVEVLGLSYSMQYDEIINEVYEYGYNTYKPDEYGFPIPCITGQPNSDYGCVFNFMTSTLRKNHYSTNCKSEIDNIRQCFLDKNITMELVEEECPVSVKNLQNCVRGLSEENNPDKWVLLHFNIDNNGNYNAQKPNYIIFGCGVFNGCDYSKIEIENYFQQIIQGLTKEKGLFGTELRSNSGEFIEVDPEDKSLTFHMGDFGKLGMTNGLN